MEWKTIGITPKIDWGVTMYQFGKRASLLSCWFSRAWSMLEQAKIFILQCVVYADLDWAKDVIGCTKQFDEAKILGGLCWVSILPFHQAMEAMLTKMQHDVHFESFQEGCWDCIHYWECRSKKCDWQWTPNIHRDTPRVSEIRSMFYSTVMSLYVQCHRMASIPHSIMWYMMAPFICLSPYIKNGTEKWCNCIVR